MEMIALILSGLALLAATVCMGLLIHEKRRNTKRNAAAVRLIDSMDSRAKEAEKALDQRIENLEQGVVPDYAAAQAAANAVNDFNKGISNILGFDPVAALQTQRKNERQVDGD